jgi:glycerol-3-phosphate dehydrogenase
MTLKTCQVSSGTERLPSSNIVAKELTLKRNITNLTDREFDLVVVGAGIFGICVAWDAAQRGLSVALIDKGDFSHATSANHFKMVHGGIRYLQHGDLKRVRQSSQERNILLRIAPHLVQPMPFVLPTYGHGLQGKEIMAAGLLLYDLLTLDRNQGLSDSQRQIPRGRLLSRADCLALFPHLEAEGLTGAAVFCEAQMYNPPRLSLAFLQSAVAAGAQAANYVSATGLLKQGKQVIGVQAHDLLNGTDFEIRGRFVVNATGPWANHWLAEALERPLQARPAFSRDAYFVVKRPLVSQEYSLALKAQTQDADALISRGHRHLFLIPWRGHTLVGVWHVAYQGGPEDYEVTGEDLEQFLQEVNGAYPGLDLTSDDIATYNAGLILFGEHESQGNELSFGKRSLIVDHAAEDGVEGLLTLIGVRYTTARGTAEKVIDQILARWGEKAAPSQTAVTPLWGGQIEQFDEYVRQAKQQAPVALDQAALPALIHNYGSKHQNVLRYLAENPAWGRRLGASNVIAAEVIHAVRDEMAVTLADVVLRRTELGTGSYPGTAVLHQCARLMAPELGWTEADIQAEIAQTQTAFPAVARHNAVLDTNNAQVAVPAERLVHT